MLIASKESDEKEQIKEDKISEQRIKECEEEIDVFETNLIYERNEGY